MNKIGYFIAFEGVDGSGKDTVLRNISSLFFTEDVSKKSVSLSQRKYHNFLVTYEPTTSSQEGKKIYEVGNHLSLLPFSKYAPEKLAELYIKDRIKHSKFIRRIIANDVTVLCSRYDLSTYAYQTSATCPFDLIYNKHLYDEPQGTLIPDLTLFLSIPEDISRERVSMKDQKNKDNYDIDKHSTKNIIKSYEQAIENLKKKQRNRKIITIDATKPPNEVLEDCIKEIRKLFDQQQQKTAVKKLSNVR